MDTKTKRAWIEALRSGKYKQGEGALKDGRKFCCLGVLATIRGCEWKRTDGSLVPHFAKKPVGDFSDYGDGSMYLNPRFAGLAVSTQVRLGKLNDQGKSFKEIADEIAKTIR